MPKFEKGHTKGFKKGQSGNPTGKSAAQHAAEAAMRQRVADAVNEGVSPLEMMLTTARDLWNESAPKEEGGRPNLSKRMQAVALAEKIAPYIHPRLSSVQAEVAGKDGGPVQVEAVLQYQLPSNGRDPA